LSFDSMAEKRKMNARTETILKVLIGELRRQADSSHWPLRCVDANNPEDVVIVGHVDLATLAMTVDAALTVDSALKTDTARSS
jgi:hypothetical protein